MKSKSKKSVYNGEFLATADQRNSHVIKGTKLIKSDQPIKDLVFQAIDNRMNAQDSVLYWTYSSEDQNTKLEVEFIDQSPMLRVILDPYNLGQIQDTLAIIDNYFLTKSQRS